MSKAPPEPGRIVVGVDGSAVSRWAVLWAAEEARIRHNVLLVTHIDQPAAYAPDLHDAATACHRLLLSCATLASDAQPSVAVGTLLLSGSISDELISLSHSATMLVVGVDREVPRASHGVIGSVEDRVVVQAHCPVVTVSAPAPRGRDDRYVAVGWIDDASGSGMLAVAVAEAAARRVALTIVPGPPVTVEAGPRMLPAVQTDPADPNLQAALTATAREHPELTVTVDWPVTDWAQAMVDHSTHASLVVVGSHHSDDRWSIRAGATAELILRQATGPVMLIGGPVRGQRAVTGSDLPVSR
jgi:nucleotide-binding universal stress UspA family protein